MSELFNPEEVTFDTLVGEGKKYKTADDAAKKIVHADKHITDLESELAELRTELASRVTVEEMLEKIQAPKPPMQTPTREESPTQRQELGSPKKDTEVDLQTEVQKLLRAEKDKDRRDANIATARAGLRERFGADYNAKVKQIASDLEVTEEYLTSIAASSPNGFLKLIASVAPKDDTRPSTPPNSSVNPNGVQNGSDKKNAAYFRELKKSDPTAYFSKRVQKDMHDQAMRMGPAFYE